MSAASVCISITVHHHGPVMFRSSILAHSSLLEIEILLYSLIFCRHHSINTLINVTTLLDVYHDSLDMHACKHACAACPPLSTCAVHLRNTFAGPHQAPQHVGDAVLMLGPFSIQGPSLQGYLYLLRIYQSKPP